MLQVSLDGQHFAEGQFPPGQGINNKAYTILESSTGSVFLHVTTSSKAGGEYGDLFKVRLFFLVLHPRTDVASRG
jgi:hypothetical protein